MYLHLLGLADTDTKMVFFPVARAFLVSAEVACAVSILVLLSSARPPPKVDAHGLSVLVADSTRYLGAGPSLASLIEAGSRNRDPNDVASEGKKLSSKRQNGAT